MPSASSSGTRPKIEVTAVISTGRSLCSAPVRTVDKRDLPQMRTSEPVTLTLRRSPHGPIINDALGESAGKTPIAMWWAFLETDNPILEGFYQLNRADTLEKARTASEKIESPGLNVIWANAKGDIGWWAAAKLPRVAIQKPQRVVGTNTVACMQSGIFWGYIGLVREICDRIKSERDRPMKIIATGGLAPLFQQSVTLFDSFEDDLTMHGLTVMHNYNKEHAA